jgi:hypothetical protein
MLFFVCGLASAEAVDAKRANSNEKAIIIDRIDFLFIDILLWFNYT